MKGVYFGPQTWRMIYMSSMSLRNCNSAKFFYFRFYFKIIFCKKSYFQLRNNFEANNCQVPKLLYCTAHIHFFCKGRPAWTEWTFSLSKIFLALYCSFKAHWAVWHPTSAHDWHLPTYHISWTHGQDTLLQINYGLPVFRRAIAY